MRLRQILAGVVFAAGLVAGGIGAFVTRYSHSPLHGAEFFVVAVTFMAASVMYLMAADDPEARAKMLGEPWPLVTGEASPVVDLRDPVVEEQEVSPTRSRVRA